MNSKGVQIGVEFDKAGLEKFECAAGQIKSTSPNITFNNCSFENMSINYIINTGKDE